MEYMSRHVFMMPYPAVKALIYPRPRYKTFFIKKRNGAPRVIREPRLELKQIQHQILEFLEARSGRPKPCVHGFTDGRSIVTNARQHIERKPNHLLNLDLEDFFPSISFYRVRGVLQKAPFSFSHSVATVIAHICTLKDGLPQGAPTSPFLSNLICRSLDRDLMALAKRHRALYTRYADDMTFSFLTRDPSRLPANIVSFDSGALRLGLELQGIIETTHSFRINPAKSRVSSRLHRLEITGITSNEFPNVKRIFLDRIRGALGAWKSHGYAAAQAGWESRVVAARTAPYEDRVWKRQTRTGKCPELKNVLWGKLLYVRMVRGKDDAIYTRLAERYNQLCEAEKAVNKAFQASSLPIEPIVRNAADAEIAVFVVEWSGDFQPAGTIKSEVISSQGTAFAYRANDHLITCDHVLRWTGTVNGLMTGADYSSPDVHGVSLTVHNPTLGKTWDVRVVHRDAARDLAILEFVEESPVRRHFSGADAAIKRNDRGVLVGFPNWSPGRGANQVPALVVSRYARSALQRFEISQMIRQGNSGGPFIDELFRVVGVAQQGARQDGGNDECLCSMELDSWIAAWEAALAAASTPASPVAPSPAPPSSALTMPI